VFYFFVVEAAGLYRVTASRRVPFLFDWFICSVLFDGKYKGKFLFLSFIEALPDIAPGG
jgi:hypothetical protein